MITSGDTQALPRIPVPGVAVGQPLPTVALTITSPARAAEETPAAPAEETPARPAATPAVGAVTAESQERIYEEAMATIAALASNWSSAASRTPGRHRAAA